MVLFQGSKVVRIMLAVMLASWTLGAGAWQRIELTTQPGAPHILKHQLSANEKWLVFIDDARNRLFSVHLETRQKHDLTHGIPEVIPEQKIRDFQIAPDNVHVAFSIAGLLYVSKLNGTDRRLVTAELSLPEEPWSPKRAYAITSKGILAYMTDYAFQMVPVAGGAPAWDPWDAPRSPRLLRVSPDGERIALVTSSLGENIQVIKTATGDATIVFPYLSAYFAENSIHDLQFSPDGKKLVVLGDGTEIRDGQYETKRYLLSGEVDGDYFPLLFPLAYDDGGGGGIESGFTITPDSKRVLYQLANSGSPISPARLKSIPILGGATTAVPQGVDYTHVAAWQAVAGATPRVVTKLRLRDGSNRYYSSHYDGHGAVALGPPSVTEDVRHPYWDFRISVTAGRLIYLTTNTQDQVRITSADLATGQAASFGPSPNLALFQEADPASPWVYYSEVVYGSGFNYEVLLKRVHSVTGVKETLTTLNHGVWGATLSMTVLRNGSVLFADTENPRDFTSSAYVLVRPDSGVELQAFESYE